MFSIVVPAYNSSAYISTCIDSVLGQTDGDFQLILVDDGSTDDTLAICRRYAEQDPRITVLHKDNGGHTSARNAGLEMAEGAYVLFLDSDDWYTPQTLELCRKEIEVNRPDIVIFRMQNSNATAPFSVLLGDGCYEVASLPQLTGDNLVIGDDGRFVFPKSLSAKCFRRDCVYQSQMAVPQDIRIGEDGAAFIGAMLRAERVSVIAADERACYWCLVRADSVSRTADGDAFSKAISLLLFYHTMLAQSGEDYTRQFHRYVVAQLYTATLLALRNGGGRAELDAGLNTALTHPVIAEGLKKASFSRKGYRFYMKKQILRHRLWGLAKRLDG